jgi:large subunit ribosomal protein L22
MEVIAQQKYYWMSPKKIRVMVDVVKKMTPLEAIEKLPFIGKKAAEPLSKVITQAIANAKNKGLSDKDLVFKEIQINEGPRFKRGRPVSRGQWHPIKKRTSHIRVVLTTKSQTSLPAGKVPNSKSETNSNVKNSKYETKKKGEK